jgi:hypothetical protein
MMKMIEIQLVGSLYGAGPNIRRGCVASIGRDEPFIFMAAGDAPTSTSGMLAMFDNWCATPVYEGNTTYPGRYILSPVAILRDMCANKTKKVTVGMEIYVRELRIAVIEKIERAIANSAGWEAIV